MSLASDPELTNSTLDIGTGASAKQTLGELDRGRVGLAAEHVIARQPAQLRLGGPDQPGLAEAERRAPEAGHALEVAMALGVDHIDALAAVDHERPRLGVVGQIGERMDQAFPVPGGQGVRARHSAAPPLCSASQAIDPHSGRYARDPCNPQ